jgi:hypothetical protein
MWFWLFHIFNLFLCDFRICIQPFFVIVSLLLCSCPRSFYDIPVTKDLYVCSVYLFLPQSMYPPPSQLKNTYFRPFPNDRHKNLIRGIAAFSSSPQPLYMGGGGHRNVNPVRAGGKGCLSNCVLHR